MYVWYDLQLENNKTILGRNTRFSYTFVTTIVEYISVSTFSGLEIIVSVIHVQYT